MISEVKNLALLTDLYELTMAACYFEQKMFDEATFSLFVRDYPAHRRYFVAAGLEEVLNYLKNLRFSAEDLDYLEQAKLFRSSFLSYLENFRFRGDVYALPEGRIFFASEPLLEISAPLIEAQIVETFIINAVNLQTMIATKASRCFQAAWPRKLVDFSLRRTHGVDAGLKVARASFIGGFIGTSNVLAGKIYGLPIFGTMAHSFITSFNKEIEAFQAFAQSFPDNTVFLVDTYDTIAGVRKAVKIGKKIAREGKKLKGVRLDSGDMVSLSQQVRQILLKEGLKEVTIFASGGFDEYNIQEILEKGGTIDSFGVGTKMGVSADAPYLDMAYKLAQYKDRPVLKLSPRKMTLPSEKQVFRFKNDEGKLLKDIIGLRDDKLEGGEPLLKKVMAEGEIIASLPSLSQIQKTFLSEFALLPERFKAINPGQDFFPVGLSSRLKQLRTELVQKLKREELGES